MNYYKVPLTLKSPLGTPLAADTLFGHICWSIVYHRGQAALTDFLGQMRSPQPPLIISDPLPHGQLPMPVLPTMPQRLRDKILKRIAESSWQRLEAQKLIAKNESLQKKTDQPNLIAAADILKQLNQRKWLPIDTIAQMVNSLDYAGIINTLLNEAPPKTPELPKDQLKLTPHNVINRLDNASENLFFCDERFTDTGGTLFDLYVSTVYPPERLSELLSWALEGGYGRDKSTGRGVIELGQPEAATLPAATHPNAVILLGPCMPAPKDPTGGYWQIHAKAPKLGGPWAVGIGPDGKHHNPFKYPLVMLQAGSVLLDATPRRWYGRMAGDVHYRFKEIVQYGLALALPVRLAQLDESEVA